MNPTASKVQVGEDESNSAVGIFLSELFIVCDVLY